MRDAASLVGYSVATVRGPELCADHRQRAVGLIDQKPQKCDEHLQGAVQERYPTAGKCAVLLHCPARACLRVCRGLKEDVA